MAVSWLAGRSASSRTDDELHVAAESATARGRPGSAAPTPRSAPAAGPGGCAHAAMIASGHRCRSPAHGDRSQREARRPQGGPWIEFHPWRRSTMAPTAAGRKGRWRDAWHGSGARRASSHATGRPRLLGVRVARTLYGRWRRMAAPTATRLERLGRRRQGARAGPPRARPTGQAAGASCARPTKRWPTRWWSRPRPIPSVSGRRGGGLRDDLARELERLASAESGIERPGSRYFA